MLTIFERAVFRQFLVINAIYFCVIMGLFSVIDLFDNANDFISHGEEGGILAIVAGVLAYYGRQSLFIFDAAALPLVAISLLSMLLILRRKGQIKPFLSAGIPAYRILIPALLCGCMVMAGVKILNREVLLGNAIHQLHVDRGKEKTLHSVIPRYDHSSQILIDGQWIFPEPEHSRIEQAMFVLPPEIAGSSMICLRSEEARYYPKQGQRPAGWLLKKASPSFSEIPLTSLGKTLVLASKQQGNVFVVSDVTPDMVYEAKDSGSILSTSQLLPRINSPAVDATSARDLEFLLHARVVEPLLICLMVWIAIPMVLRRECRGALLAAFNCGMVMTLFIGSTHAVRFLSSSQLVEPIQAAWLPLFCATPVAAWILDRVES